MALCSSTLLALLLGLAFQGEGDRSADVEGTGITAHFAARILPVDGPPIDDGVLLVRDGKILDLGTRGDLSVPNGARRIEHGEAWLSPGFVDIHHHVSSGGGDINDMVLPINAELRTLDTIDPHAELIRRTVSGGVTTTLFIPGSGTNISGFGAVLKMIPGGPLADMIVRELGAMKVAQGFNPERRSGDLGNSRLGSRELLTVALERGRSYARAWRDHEEGLAPAPPFDAELEQLRKVFDGDVPVIIHTAGARDCVATARMFQHDFRVRMVLSHGSFDGWLAADALVEWGTPVNLGPRMYQLDRRGRLQGMCAAFWDAGCRDLSINTDAPVIAPEELQLQAAMAIRLGLPYEAALLAITLTPAHQIGIDDRVGSLAIGKDADFQITAGDPLDPRHGPRLVYIEGTEVYRQEDGR